MSTQAILPGVERRLHRALLETLLATGAVPSAGVLAQIVGIAPDELPARLQALIAADYAALNAAGDLTCLYPLSAVPTPHVVLIDGEQRHALCAIDALGIPAMLDRELSLASTCGVCRRSIELRVRPGAVVAVDPETTMVVAPQDGEGSAVEFCCPATLFVCGLDHGQQLVTRLPTTQLLALPDALEHGEAIFRDLLRAETLPAHRRRSHPVTPGSTDVIVAAP